MGELTEDHVESTDGGLAVDAPTGADEIRVDRAYVRDRLGAWGADHAFTLDNGRVIADVATVTFTSFQPNATPTYTLGSQESIRFAERPMWLSVDQDGDGPITVTADAEDTTGQPVEVDAEWLWDRGLIAPQAVHEDGTSIPVAWVEGGWAYRVDVPHFSAFELCNSFFTTDTGDDCGSYEDVSVELDVKVRIDGVVTDHDGQELWDAKNRTLHVEVDDYRTEVDVLVERAWVDDHIDRLAVWRRNFTVETVDGAEYYVSSFPADDTPTDHVLREYQAANKTMYTRGSPDSIKLWAVNETAFNNMELMITNYNSSDPHTLNVSYEGQGDFLLRFNDSWLSGQNLSHPRFLIDGNETDYIQLENGTDWIVPLFGNATMTIQNRTNATSDPVGRIDFVREPDVPDPAPPEVNFGPEDYDPFHIFRNGSSLEDYEPPRSVEINGSGTVGETFHPGNYSSLGMGADWMPADANQSYRLGIWLGTANLHGIHESLAENYTAISDNRRISPPYAFQYGIPRFSVPASNQMWSVFENRSFPFASPYASGPGKNRTLVSLTQFAETLSVCKIQGNCTDVRDLRFEVREDGVENDKLEDIVSQPLTNVTNCLEDNASCPVSEESLVNFTDGYRRGLENGTFSSNASLSVSVQDGNGSLDCSDCGIGRTVEDLLNGTRILANTYNRNESHFEMTLSALAYLGCIDIANWTEENHTHPDCDDDNATVENADLFPFLSPDHIRPSQDGPLDRNWECTEQEVWILLTVVEVGAGLGVGPRLDVSVSRPEMSPCWGLGDLDDFGDALTPGVASPLGGCSVLYSTDTFASCEADDSSITYVRNVNPLSFAANYPHCGSGSSCATLGTAWAKDQIESHTSKRVNVAAINISMPWGCSHATLERWSGWQHDLLHEENNSAFIATFAPYYCFKEISGDDKGWGGTAASWPVNEHVHHKDDTHNTVLWMWDAVSPWIAPHEFGHAFSADHDTGRCWDAHEWDSPHWPPPHSTHMTYSSAEDAREKCADFPVWLRHLHAEFTDSAQKRIEKSIEGWNEHPEGLHE